MASIADCESVKLFVEPAAASTPGFAVDDRNATTIAQIVQRLDGLPLAIDVRRPVPVIDDGSHGHVTATRTVPCACWSGPAGRIQ